LRILLLKKEAGKGVIQVLACNQCEATLTLL
jgi:hypothetical protein